MNHQTSAPIKSPKALTEAELEAIEKVEAQGTPAPWLWSINKHTLEIYYLDKQGSVSNIMYQIDGEVWSEQGREGIDLNDASLTVAARNVLPRLLAEVRALRNLDSWTDSMALRIREQATEITRLNKLLDSR